MNHQIFLPGMWVIGFIKTSQWSVGELVYYFRRCNSKFSFGILRTPFFLCLEQFLGEFKHFSFFFSKLHLAFSFLLSSLPWVFLLLQFQGSFSLTSDICFFTNSRLLGNSFMPLLKKPLLYSKLALFSLSSIGCSYVFSLFGRLQFQNAQGKLHE